MTTNDPRNNFVRVHPLITNEVQELARRFQNDLEQSQLIRDPTPTVTQIDLRKLPIATIAAVYPSGPDIARCIAEETDRVVEAAALQNFDFALRDVMEFRGELLLIFVDVTPPNLT